MEVAQQSDDVLKSALHCQDEKAPVNNLAVGEWLAQVGDVVPLLAMALDDPVVNFLPM